MGAADVYTYRLEEAKQIAPDAKTYLDYRHLLDDKSIDAVLIATPQHLHAEYFVAALDAGKHVYQEKTMAFTVDHAKRMRAAYQRAPASAPCRSAINGRSLGQLTDAREFPQARAAWARSPRSTRTCTATRRTASRSGRGPIRPDMTPENIVWKSFLGEAPQRTISTPTATSTGASSGIIPAATSTRTCATSSRSGTRR